MEVEALSAVNEILWSLKGLYTNLYSHQEFSLVLKIHMQLIVWWFGGKFVSFHKPFCIRELYSTCIASTQWGCHNACLTNLCSYVWGRFLFYNVKFCHLWALDHHCAQEVLVCPRYEKIGTMSFWILRNYRRAGLAQKILMLVTGVWGHWEKWD